MFLAHCQGIKHPECSAMSKCIVFGLKAVNLVWFGLKVLNTPLYFLVGQKSLVTKQSALIQGIYKIS